MNNIYEFGMSFNVLSRFTLIGKSILDGLTACLVSFKTTQQDKYIYKYKYIYKFIYIYLYIYNYKDKYIYNIYNIHYFKLYE